MRPFLLLTALAFTAVAVAQRPEGAHESEVWEAYLNLRANDALKFTLTGTDTTGSVSKPVHADLWWRLSFDSRTGKKSRAEVELNIYGTNAKGNEEIAYRIVGDGTTLYRYDIAKRELSATAYGFYGDRPPSGYPGSDVPKLLQQIRAATPGPAAYIARLLSEVNPSGDERTSKFNSWDPGLNALSFDEAWNRTPSDARTRSGSPKKLPAGVLEANILLDPLTDTPYLRGDPQFTRWFFYRVDQDAPRQTMAVRMRNDAKEDGDPPIWNLDTWQMTKFSGDRALVLAIDARPKAAPSWAYVPYRGTEGAAFRPVNRGN